VFGSQSGALEAIDDNLFHIPGQSDGAQAYTFGHYWWWSFAGFTNKQVHVVTAAVDEVGAREAKQYGVSVEINPLTPDNYSAYLVC